MAWFLTFPNPMTSTFSDLRKWFICSDVAKIRRVCLEIVSSAVYSYVLGNVTSTNGDPKWTQHDGGSWSHYN